MISICNANNIPMSDLASELMSDIVIQIKYIFD